MSPEVYAELKAIQIKLAKIALNYAIPLQYKGYKRANSKKINNLRDQYDQSVINTYDLSNQTLEGKTKEKLLETLTSLVKDDDRLLEGVKSILLGQALTNTSRSHNVPDPIKASLVSNQIVGVTDEFLKTKSKLSDSEPSLKAIKQQNNNLFDDLLGIFNKIVDQVAGLLSLLSYPEVHAIAVSEGLHPDKNIDRGQVAATSTYIDNKLTKIDDTITKMIRAFTELHYTDDQMASIFGISVDLIKSKKKKNKNQWVEEMESRDQEATISYYQNFYGLTREEAELLYQYDLAFIEYVKRENLDPQQACYEYSMYIASFSYGNDTMFSYMAGTINTDKLRAKFTEEFNFTDEEFDTLSRGINRSHYPGNSDFYDKETSIFIPDPDDPKGENYTIIIDGQVITGEQYRNNTLDIAHTHASVALMISDDFKVDISNQAIGPGNPVKVYGENDGFATFHGDISSGTLDQRDTRADAEALNIITGYRESNYSKGPLTVINEYNQAIANAEDPNKKRMEILSGEDEDFAGAFNSREELKAYIKGPILDLNDNLLKARGYYDAEDDERKTNFITYEEQEEMWGYIEDDLG